jgi:dihydrofolate reductase
MRLVKLFIASSLDGYIARENGGIDWLFSDQDYGFGAFFASVDTVVMGRHTYDLALSFPEYPYAEKAVYVFSRSQPAGKDERGSHITSESPGNLLSRLRDDPGKDIWLVGGGQLVRSFLDEDLIDRLDVFIHPVLLGSGLPLFPRGAAQTHLVFEGTTSFVSGLVQLSYTRP